MQGPEIFLVVGVIVLLFGGSQLPKLARSLGQAKNEFEKAQSTSAAGGTTVETTRVVETKADDQA